MNTFFFDTDDLIAEHFAGCNTGLLSMAQDFVLRFQATHGYASEDLLAEAAFEEGFCEAEIAAALSLVSGDYAFNEDPRGTEWLIK